MSNQNRIQFIQEALQAIPVGAHKMVHGVSVVRWGEDAWEVHGIGGVPVGITEAVTSVATHCAIPYDIVRSYDTLPQ